MIEYLYNTIRATVGDDMHITAIITDDQQNLITENCSFMIHDTNDKLISSTLGVYQDEAWLFNIPTTGLEKGKYWYCICYGNQKLCFKQRLYLV